MTEFVLDGFSCRAEGSGDVLVMLFSGFDEQLFLRGLRACSGLPLRSRRVWRNRLGQGLFPVGGKLRRAALQRGGAERLLAFLPDFTAELEKRFGRFGSVYLLRLFTGRSVRALLRTRSGTNRGSRRRKLLRVDMVSGLA